MWYNNGMKNMFIVMTAALALAGCFQDGADAAKQRAKVGTYNIRMMWGDKDTPNAWEARREDMAAQLKSFDLDAGGLQEVCPDQETFLREKMPEYAFVGDHRGEDRIQVESSNVFFKTNRFELVKTGTFWLSETPEEPGKKGWGAACPRVCTWALLKDRKSGRRLCFANTHTDHVSALARAEGMKLILERMKTFSEGAPVVFTGDHNCRETEEPAKLAAETLKNAIYVSKTPPAGPWRTLNLWQWRDVEKSCAEALASPIDARNACKGSPDGSKEKHYEEYGVRIDYIYVSPVIDVLDVVTHGEPRPGTKLYPSDHFPVTATIEF